MPGRLHRPARLAGLCWHGCSLIWWSGRRSDRSRWRFGLRTAQVRLGGLLNRVWRRRPDRDRPLQAFLNSVN
jgi:hypothetical protein